MVLYHPIHIAYSNDWTHTERHPYLGNCNFADTALCNIYSYGLACRQDLSRGYIYARQEAISQRALQMVEILKLKESQMTLF